MNDTVSVNLKHLHQQRIWGFTSFKCSKFKSLYIQVNKSEVSPERYTVFCRVDGNAKKIKNYISATVGGESRYYCARRDNCTSEEVIQILTTIDDGIEMLYGKKPKK